VLQDFPAHRGVVMAAVLTPEGDQVISAGFDGTVRIWDVLSGKEVSQARIARSAVPALDISPDGHIDPTAQVA
jgi:WD40 repeat protein